jgi:diguanylate cyclase (GGDEF)-like protein/PAS domain S-box-containing protein
MKRTKAGVRAALKRAERVAGAGSWEADLPGKRFFFSEEALRLHGLAPGAFGGTADDALGLVHPEDRERVLAALNATLERRAPFAVEFRIVRPDGTVRHMHAEGDVVRDGAGAALRAFGITQDVTERIRAERALHEEQERLALLAENVPAMIAYIDADHRYRYANPRYRLFYGGSEAPIAGRRIQEVLTPQTWEAARASFARALAGETVSYEGERWLHDGSRRYVSVSLVPHRGEGGAVLGLYILAMDITARHQAQRALRESEAGMRHAQEMAGLAYVVLGTDGRYERWSESWPRVLGLEPARLPKTTRESLDMVHADDRERFRQTAVQAARSRQRTVLEYRMQRGDGALAHLLQIMEPLGEPDAAGRVRWFVTMQDITERKLAESRIQRLNRVYAVRSGINAAIVRIRDRQELYQEVCRIGVERGGFPFVWLARVDAAGQRLVPVASAGEAGDFMERIRERLSLRDQVPGGHGLAAVAVRERRAVFVNDVEGSPHVLLKDLHRALGIRAVGVLPIVVEGAPVAALGLQAAEAGFFDEQEQRLLLELAGDIAFALDHIEKEERVRYLAYYDALTGLANRSLLLERLAAQTAAARERAAPLALAILNVERFKSLNDTLGRLAGDELLRQVAQRLGAAAGDSSRVARVGADEFALVRSPAGGRDEEAQWLREAQARVTREPFVLGGRELRVSLRAGVAVFPADGADADSLFRNAEAALRRARGGEPLVFYAPEMTERSAEKLELENRLRLAVERGEFVLYYQPKLDLATRRITGAEALIRWQSAELGLVPPARFIPMLEETGLIGQVGGWALAQAVDDQQRWRSRGRAAPRVSVNVSALELRRPDFVAGVKAALARGVAPLIDLEITESVLMEDLERNVQTLKALRELGVGAAIDDFGTGYSSLGYLARLPVQTLKIDRSFIVTMLDNQDVTTLVSTIVSMSRALRLRVVAEGVDSEAQARTLYLLGCDEVQGHLFGKAVPAAEFEALLPA